MDKGRGGGGMRGVWRKGGGGGGMRDEGCVEKGRGEEE